MGGSLVIDSAMMMDQMTSSTPLGRTFGLDKVILCLSELRGPWAISLAHPLIISHGDLVMTILPLWRIFGLSKVILCYSGLRCHWAWSMSHRQVHHSQPDTYAALSQWLTEVGGLRWVELIGELTGSPLGLRSVGLKLSGFGMKSKS